MVRCGSHNVAMSVILGLNPTFHRLLLALSYQRLATQYEALIDRLAPVLDSTISLSSLIAFRDRKPSSVGVRLIDAMLVLRPLHSTDPRDKLFAALGISKNVERIMPDYSGNAEDLFRDYAREHIRSSASIHILGYCQYAPKVGYSTWAPDWGWSSFSRTSLSSRGSLQSGKFGKGMNSALFSAGGDGPLVEQFRNDNRLLVLQGILLDKVIFVGSDPDTWPESLKARGLYGNLFEWAATLKVRRGDFPLIGCADWQFNEMQGYEQFRRPVYHVTRESVLFAYARTINTDTMTNKHTGQLQRLWEKDGFQNPNVTFGRRFAVSALGYLCMLPDEASLGDKIVLVKGGQVPLLLRPQQANFQLIGECYVHGIMDGKVMKKVMEHHLLKEICIV